LISCVDYLTSGLCGAKQCGFYVGIGEKFKVSIVFLGPKQNFLGWSNIFILL